MNGGRMAAALACAAALASCGPREQIAEMKIARALDALQQGNFNEAARCLESVKSGGGWLRSPAWSVPLALRLRIQISLRTGAAGEARRLLGEYAGRYPEFGPAAFVKGRLEFLDRYQEAGGEPALLYLRGAESEEDNPPRALDEWQRLLRDFPDSALVPATLLRQGLLQARLGNDAWALAALGRAAGLELDAVDFSGNAVAPQARLAMGRIRRDLMDDRRGAAEEFGSLIRRYPDCVLRVPGEEIEYRPALSASYEKALLDLAAGAGEGPLRELAGLAKGPSAYVSEELLGDVKGEARLVLAEKALNRQEYGRTRELLVSVVRDLPLALRGPLHGPGRRYGFEAVDRLSTGLGRRAPDQAIQGLEEMAKAAKAEEMWAYVRLQQVRVLARLGMQAKAGQILAEMERRFPNLDCDARGDGTLFIAAREAKRVLGGTL